VTSLRACDATAGQARASFAAATLVAIFAFILFRSTMLPGVELGDSASFQVMVDSKIISPRDAYPLYFAVADVFHWIVGGEAARAMNLASVLEAAIACGLIVVAAAELSGSLSAAVVAALMFAVSYTFWSQAVIAEVYALHILLVALTLLLLLRWEREPSLGRLTLFFAVYALSFGNHLMMILLAPAYALFVLVAMPGGWRAALAPRVVVPATLLAIAGAAQYLWNLRTLWFTPMPPASLSEGLQKFWFDVTKADWRSVMMAGVSSDLTRERLRMYAFDVHQQFGWLGPALAIIGLGALAWRSPARALLMLLAYAGTVGFALSYNVGDSHVFFLPSHLLIALLAAPAVALVGDFLNSRLAVAVVLIVLSLARTYRDFPALDRSHDQRPLAALSALTEGLDDRRDVLVIDLNWQLENGVMYVGKHERRNVAHTLLSEVLPHAPNFLRDNAEIGRAIVLNGNAKAQFDRSPFGGRFTSIADSRVSPSTIADLARAASRGTRYVLCALDPVPPFVIDQPSLSDALRRLTGGRLASLGSRPYAMVAGLVGEEPVITTSESVPFRERFALDGLDVDMRMEAWLVFDTIRRMGFGHVIAGRQHTLIVERGVSFVTIDPTGAAIVTGYDGNIFASERRYLVGSTSP